MVLPLWRTVRRALKDSVNLPTKEKQTHRMSREIYGYQRERRWARMIQESGYNLYTALATKYIINKDHREL